MVWWIEHGFVCDWVQHTSQVQCHTRALSDSTEHAELEHASRHPPDKRCQMAADMQQPERWASLGGRRLSDSKPGSPNWPARARLMYTRISIVRHWFLAATYSWGIFLRRLHAVELHCRGAGVAVWLGVLYNHSLRQGWSKTYIKYLYAGPELMFCRDFGVRRYGIFFWDAPVPMYEPCQPGGRAQGQLKQGWDHYTQNALKEFTKNCLFITGLEMYHMITNVYNYTDR